MKIGVVGLGKLGLPLAAVLAEKFKVIGIDTNKQIIKKIKKGVCPYNEPNLFELLLQTKKNLIVSTDYQELKDCSIIMIILPTPSLPDGRFSNKYIEKAINEINKTALKCELIVINSTIMPGTCNEILKNVKCGLCYNPEFIALGSVIKDLKNPDFVLIGESEKKYGDILESVYKKLHNKRISHTSLLNAEIAKIALNSFVTMKINFANTLGEICENLSGQVDEVTNIIGNDRRIGHAFLKSGMPFGGTCFPRDNKAFSIISPSLIQYFVDQENRLRHINRIANICEKILPLKRSQICILGKAYKQDTDVTTESPSIWLAEELAKRGAYAENFSEDKFHKIRLKEYDLVILTIPSIKILEIPIESFKKMKIPRVLDCWRMRPDLKGMVDYHCLGE